jgi:hypothetical protein
MNNQYTTKDEHRKYIYDYSKEVGCLYTGWAAPSFSRRFHYFIDAMSLCGKWEHFARPAHNNDLDYIPNSQFIKTCSICLKKYKILKQKNDVVKNNGT